MNSSTNNQTYAYMTIKEMRWKLRISGVFAVEDYNDHDIVELFNARAYDAFIFIGIDKNGYSIEPNHALLPKEQ